MPTNGWQSSPRDAAALCVENVDRMPHDVAVTVTDGAGERVFEAEFGVWHGDDAVHDNVFTTEGPYDVTVTVRYGPTEQLRHDGGTLYLTITDEPTEPGSAESSDETGAESSAESSDETGAESSDESSDETSAESSDEPGNQDERDAFTRGAADESDTSAVERNV